MKPTVEKFGDFGIRLYWKAKIDPDVHSLIVAWSNQIKEELGTLIQDITLSYNELAVYLKDPFKQALILDELKKQELKQDFLINQSDSKKVYIPVCYENEYSIDGESFCNSKNISREEMVKLHTSTEYPVYFMGFLPGFPYLGGLSEKLYHPRKSTPRKSVPKGAVGIAGAQTGIYPSRSPGGWNIIGRSPMPLFNPEDISVTLLNAGDAIIFYTINTEAFKKLEKELSTYSLSELRGLNHKIYKEHHDRS